MFAKNDFVLPGGSYFKLADLHGRPPSFAPQTTLRPDPARLPWYRREIFYCWDYLRALPSELRSSKSILASTSELLHFPDVFRRAVDYDLVVVADGVAFEANLRARVDVSPCLDDAYSLGAAVNYDSVTIGARPAACSGDIDGVR